MRPSGAALGAISLLGISWTANAYHNYSRADLLRSDFSVLDDRPEGCPQCPSCFNCNVESDSCTQFAACNKPNGKCLCPPGFGGDDCGQPLCGSLADGNQREPRKEDERSCACKEGWTGINCNVCQDNRACDALMHEDVDGGTCYKEGVVVNQNYQMCDVTNQKILDQLKEQKPQVTFSCNAKAATCDFQCRCFCPGERNSADTI